MAVAAAGPQVSKGDSAQKPIYVRAGALGLWSDENDLDSKSECLRARRKTTRRQRCHVMS